MKLKMHPWRDWNEWGYVHYLLFSQLPFAQSNSMDILSVSVDNLQKGYHLIQKWLTKNVGSDHTKYLKMQKLIILQALSMKRMFTDKKQQDGDEPYDLIGNDDKINALSFRMVQLVELGAKTNEYKKSKQGGKLAMKHIAEEFGLPTFLVHLRHQIVHENSQISMETMEIALKRLQQYLFQAFWSPIHNKLIKRDQQIAILKQQMKVYKFNTIPPPFDKMEDKEKKEVLAKFTKANLKLNIPLDINQLIDLTDYYLISTLNQINVTFKDQKGLFQMLSQFSMQQSKLDITKFDFQQFVEVKMKHQNAFACFQYYLEKKYSSTLNLIMYQQIIEKLIRFIKLNLQASLSDEKEDIEEVKKRIVSQIQLITTLILIHNYSENPFKKIIRQYDTLKVSVMKLDVFRDVDFFAWFALTKLKDQSLKNVKILRLGENMQVPIIVEDKKQSAKVENTIGDLSFSLCGQLLETTYGAYLQKNGSKSDQFSYQNKAEEQEMSEEDIEMGMFDKRLIIKVSDLIN